MSPIQIATWFAFGCFTLALLLNLWRLARGPEISDRLVALDTMTMNLIGLIVLIGLSSRLPVYFEVALIFAMFAFVSTLAFARYRLSGRVME